VKTIN